MNKYIKVGIFAVNVICMIAGLGLVYASTLGEESPVVKEEIEIKKLEMERDKRDVAPLIYTMDKFVINLDGFPRKIIQTEINLELLDKTGYEQVIRLGSKGRDVVVRVLNSKRLDDIETLQGKLQLKEDIMANLNDLMPEGVVKNVYFTDFIVK